MKKNLRDWIASHEGLRLYPYKCTADKLTIGYGRNIQDNGISIEEARLMLDNDINRCLDELKGFSWYNRQPDGVRMALVNMCFNLGISRLLGFKKMIEALEVKNYTRAAVEALDSKWAQQVGQRAKDVASMIRAGK